MENTHAVCHVTVYLHWLVLFAAMCFHPSQARESFITICLVSQVSDLLHPSFRAGSSRTPTSPPKHRQALCPLFKPITEGTHTDNYSAEAALHHKQVGRDVRWMTIWKQRREETGRSWNKGTEGYRKVRQIREKRGRTRWKREKMRESGGRSAEQHSETGNTG